MTAVQCVVLAGFTDQAYVSGVRSDALLFLAAQAAVLAATSTPTMLTAAALGLLGGVCADLKIHGVLYILPAFVYCLSRSPSTAVGLRLTCVAGVVGLLSLWPSPLARITSHYLNITIIFKQLRITPWVRWLFEQNIVFEAMCLAPLLSMYALFTPKLPRAVQLVFSSARFVHDDGYISCCGERIGTIPSPTFSSVCRLGLRCHASRGLGQPTGPSSKRQVRGSVVGLDDCPPFRLWPHRD